MPKLSSLFTMRYGHSLELNRMSHCAAPDGVNFVGRSRVNNGVTARVVNPDGVEPGVAGELTVALSGRGGGLCAFVQPEPFVCGRDVAILVPRADMTLAEKLWWARCIYENRYRYNFGRQSNRSLMSLVVPDEVPDFVRAASAGEELSGAERLGEALDLPAPGTWGSWRLEELFKIEKGSRLIKRERRPGKTPYVATTTLRNGIVGYIDAIATFPAGSISVPYNGSVGYACYQPAAYCASDDVQVLIPRTEIDHAASLFVCTVIRLEMYRYSYGRKWHMSRMKATAIRLPKTDGNLPDWTGMSTFIKGLPFSSGALSSTTTASPLRRSRRRRGTARLRR